MLTSTEKGKTFVTPLWADGPRKMVPGPIEGPWRGRGHAEAVAFVVVLLTGVMVIA